VASGVDAAGGALDGLWLAGLVGVAVTLAEAVGEALGLSWGGLEALLQPVTVSAIAAVVAASRRAVFKVAPFPGE
jgi:hypothetical protein